MVKVYTPIVDDTEEITHVVIGNANTGATKAVLFSIYVPNLNVESVVFLRPSLRQPAPLSTTVGWDAIWSEAIHPPISTENR